jgi:hypothetical protein
MKKIMLLSLVFAFPMHAMNNPGRGEVGKFLIPINGEQSKLSVRIPESDYRMIPQAILAVAAGLPHYEFVKKNGASNNIWSEIVTVVSYPMKGKSAKQSIEDMITFFVNSRLNKTTPTVIKNDVQNRGAYEKGVLVMVYDDNQRSELLKSSYYASSNGFVNLQYTVALVDGITQEDALEKIRAFEDAYVEVRHQEQK